MHAGSLGGTSQVVRSVEDGIDAAQFVQRFADAWQTHDPDELVALLANDVVLRAPLMPAVAGKAVARDAFERLFRLLPDLHATVHRWAANGEVVFIEFTLSGTFGGREVSWPAVDCFVIRDGLALERVSYFDSAPLALQMLTRPRGWRRMLSSGFRPRFGASSNSAARDTHA